MYCINLDENDYLFKNISLARTCWYLHTVSACKAAATPRGLNIENPILKYIAEEWGDKYRVTHSHTLTRNGGVKTDIVRVYSVNALGIHIYYNVKERKGLT